MSGVGNDYLVTHIKYHGHTSVYHVSVNKILHASKIHIILMVK